MKHLIPMHVVFAFAMIMLGHIANAQSHLGLSYRPVSGYVHDIKSTPEGRAMTFAFNKPIHIRQDAYLSSNTGLSGAQQPGIDEQYAPDYSFNRRDNTRRHPGLALAISGGVCFLAAGVCFAAAPNQTDDYGISALFLYAGGLVLTGGGLGLTIPGIILLSRRGDTRGSRYSGY